VFKFVCNRSECNSFLPNAGLFIDGADVLECNYAISVICIKLMFNTNFKARVNFTSVIYKYK